MFACMSNHPNTNAFRDFMKTDIPIIQKLVLNNVELELPKLYTSQKNSTHWMTRHCLPLSSVAGLADANNFANASSQ